MKKVDCAQLCSLEAAVTVCISKTRKFAIVALITVIISPFIMSPFRLCTNLLMQDARYSSTARELYPPSSTLTEQLSHGVQVH